MIKVTNGEEEFVIPDNELHKRKKELIVKQKYKYWGIELAFIIEDESMYTKIIKRYPESDCVLKQYYNLECNCPEKVVLENRDYNEIKKLYNNMYSKKDYKKEATIEAASILFSYECYQNYILELDTTVDIEYLFNDFLGMTSSDYLYYKKQIFNNAKRILKKVYNVNLDNVLDNGGK